MTDPHEMRAMAGRFDVHAQTVEDEARKMWASSTNIAGAGWSGTAQMTSYDTMGQDEPGVSQHRQHAARRIGTTLAATGAASADNAVMASVWSDGNKCE
jgi:WXG100 family type VII secretion target